MNISEIESLPVPESLAAGSGRMECAADGTAFHERGGDLSPVLCNEVEIFGQGRILLNDPFSSVS